MTKTSTEISSGNLDGDGDQPSLHPEPTTSSASQMDAPGADDDAPPVSFSKLMPLPKRSRATKRPRAKPPSYELTSDEHFQFITEKGNRAPKPKKPRTNGKSGKQPLQSKIPPDKGNRAPKPKKTRTNGKSGKQPLQSKNPVDDNVYCLYCNESFCESSEKWVQCVKCQKWAEYACAGFDKKQRSFVCDFCD